MEKEQKKLLLVAVSVGVFLLVTVTAALLLLTPKTQMSETDYSFVPIPPVEREPSAVNSNNVSQQVEKNNDQENNLINSENEKNIDTGKSKDDNQPVANLEPLAVVQDNNKDITIIYVSAESKTNVVESVKPAVVKNISSPAVSVKPVNNTAVTQSKTTVSSKTINDFWIQAGAFSQKFRADDAKELLASKGFVSIIENREIDGQTLYRVRLGPYTSENEAKYWLTLVKSINGFDGSQVRQTIR
jgi:DedD protein